MAPSAVYARAQAASAGGPSKKRKRSDVPVAGGSLSKSPAVQPLSEEEDEDSPAEAEEDEEEDGDDDEEMSLINDNSVASIKGKAKEVDGATAASRSKTFKQKTLILSSRGITHRMRHMMKDLANLLPHSKSDAKLDTKHQLSLLNELADLSNCSSLLFFEARRHADLYMWASMAPNGPSVRFHLLNAHTMDELKMTGNCLKGSRPIVVFDKSFDESAHWRLIKEVLMQIFAVPKTARRAKPFVDHVTSFSVADGRVWFRNYQIVNDAPIDLAAQAIADAGHEAAPAKKAKASKNAEENMSMNEIGPRFVLTPVKIFEGSFGGAVVWENKDFMAPTAKLAGQKLDRAAKYNIRKDAEIDRKSRREHLDTQEQADREKSGKTMLEKRRVFA